MKNRGFTLIELMITIAILAIIVGIAVPAYQNQVEKTRRADAIAGLTQAAQQMERCFTRKNTYSGCETDVLDKSPDEHYIIDFADGSPTPGTYAIKAIPTGAQTGDDCKTFTIDHLGNKDNIENTSDRCWGSN